MRATQMENDQNQMCYLSAKSTNLNEKQTSNKQHVTKKNNYLCKDKVRSDLTRLLRTPCDVFVVG